MIKLEDVSVWFKSEVVFEKINLTVEQGQSLILIGPSGQGKTVLTKLMAGILPPTKGNVLIDGINIYNDSSRHQILEKMGMLFQKNALFDSLSVAENIAFPLREKTQLSEDQIYQRVEDLLESVGILHSKDLFPDEISGGMQKRLGIARALALNPQVIFYDDPTAGLDPITSLKIVKLILNLKTLNKATMVAVTNDMNRAYQMAGKIAFICDKKVLVTGGEEETKNHKDSRVIQFIRGDLNGPLTIIQ